MYENDSDLNIVINYKHDVMSINGLQPELPPFIMFEGDAIFAGESNKKSERISADVGLQFLKALDPRLFGNKNHLEILKTIQHDTSWEFILQFDFSEIKPSLPDDFIDWLEKNGENPRNAHFFISKKNKQLQLMTQKDIYTQNFIKIKFSY